jgi:hypothetical protein
MADGLMADGFIRFMAFGLSVVVQLMLVSFFLCLFFGVLQGVQTLERNFPF